jgi:hypothetical protein
VGAIEFLADRFQLTLLELGHAQAAPTFCRADQRRVHELEHGALPKGMRDHFCPSPLLTEQPF